MQYAKDSAFYRLLATKYDEEREQEAIDILNAHPEIAKLEWPGPDRQGQPFVKGSTALHYAANDGKLKLVRRLIELGADPNATNANWFRSVLSWAANNARRKVIEYLCLNGTSAESLDAMHAAAWGGSGQGEGEEKEYAETIELLVKFGADKDDRRHYKNRTPLAVALESGNKGAIQILQSMGASES